MDLNSQQNSTPLMDFDPPMYREELEMELEFEKVASDIRLRSGANANIDDLSEMTVHSTGEVDILGENLPEFTIEEILGLSEADMDTNQCPLPNATWEDYLQGDWSQFEIESKDVSADLPTSDLPSEDVGMTDIDEYLDVENWLSGVTGEDAFLDQISPKEADVAPLELDFNDDETLGYGRHGRFDLIPQPLFDSPAAPLPLFGVPGPANNQVGNSASTVPQLLFDGKRGTRKGHFVLLKGGKPLCNLDPGSITAVLDAVSQAKPQANAYRQQQGPANTSLPPLNFTHLEAVDGPPAKKVHFTLPSAAVPTFFNREEELSALVPPPAPRPLPQQVNYTVPRASSIKLNERQERELAQRMARIYSRPKQHHNPIDRRPPRKPRKTFQPKLPENSDYARHVREAKARALQRAQAESEPEPEVAASKQATSPRHSSPGKRSSPGRRLAPRPLMSDRYSLRERTDLRSRTSSSSGLSRPLTRSFARKNRVQLESIEW